MAPATPSKALPKSNFQATIASASANAQLGAPGEGATVPQDSAGESFTNDNSEFEHPDHVIKPPNYHGVENLVIVCCHAIFHPSIDNPSFPVHSPHNEKNWHLAPFQKGDEETGKPGEHETFLAHINAGLDTLRTEPWRSNSLLVFSGGMTKSHLTPLSEAKSYYHAALAGALVDGQRSGGFPKEMFDKNRIFLEEHATDSFQNLLFSILLFRRTTSRYPKQIRVITHAFKSKRFLELHAPAIRWPADRIRVEGIDPVMSSAEYEATVQGEEKRGYAPWMDDPLGTNEFLDGKRRQRGWREECVEEINEDLEDSVKALLKGKVGNDLPWTQQPSSESVNVDLFSST